MQMMCSPENTETASLLDETSNEYLMVENPKVYKPDY